MSDSFQLALFGARQAAEHADRVEADWTERASRVLDEFIRSGTEFVVETVRLRSLERGVPPPPDGRAWGHVIMLAKRQGRVRPVRYELVNSVTHHACPRTVWIGAEGRP